MDRRTNYGGLESVIRFLDGPAEDAKGLMIRRAPLFIRAVQDRQTGEWDCLDLVDDQVRDTEAVFAYRREGAARSIHLLRRPAKGSGWFKLAEYRECDPQPPEHVMRSNRLWQEWTSAELEKQSFELSGNRDGT